MITSAHKIHGVPVSCWMGIAEKWEVNGECPEHLVMPAGQLFMQSATLGFANVDLDELPVNFFDHVLVDVRKDADRCERLGGIRNVILMIWHDAIDFEGGSGVIDLVEINGEYSTECCRCSNSPHFEFLVQVNLSQFLYMRL